MFDFRMFLKKGFLGAVGKMADYKIRLNAVGYYEKGVLTEEDLAQIDEKIDSQYVENIPEEVPAEEVAENV